MTRKLLVVALTGVVAMGGFFIAAQSGAGARSGPASTRAAAPGGLDHFLCYDAAAVAGTKPIFRVPAGVTLLNQFSPKAFVAKFQAIDLHCNPALKVIPGAKFPPLSPSWHLMCYGILGHQAPNKHLVNVSNQFGAENMTTGPPNQFCLPSLKSTATKPKFAPPGPNEIMPDHFTCYPVTRAGQGTFRPPTPLQVQDQFSPALVTVTVQQPTELCVPTQKMIRGVVKAQIKNPAAHLLCFPVSPTPVLSPIWDQNQFGTGQLSITKVNTLCLPTAKKLIR